MEKYKIILYISYGVCLLSIVTFAIGFLDLPKTVPIHQNFKGEIDDWGTKVTLLILPVLSVILLIAISLLTKRPSILNYPVEITEENKASMYRKMRLFMAILSLFIAMLFLALILQSMNIFDLKFDATFFVVYMMLFSLIPFFVIRWFGR